MTTALAIQSVLELLAIGLLLYGYMHEDKVIAFEQKVWRILFVNYRRYKRKKRCVQIQKQRDFRVVNGTARPQKAQHGSNFVA